MYKSLICGAYRKFKKTATYGLQHRPNWSNIISHETTNPIIRFLCKWYLDCPHETINIIWFARNVFLLIEKFKEDSHS